MYDKLRIVLEDMMICVPIMAKNTGQALPKIAGANRLADMLELRLDSMDSFCLKDMIRVASRPVMVTYRSLKEGGKGSAGYQTRARYLVKALDDGADLVDVEYSMPPRYRDKVLERLGSRAVVSVHLLDTTPCCKALERILRDLTSTGAPIVKIVTFAAGPEDNLRVLNLIPAARELGVRIIAFCMGPLGRISRIASPLLGSFLTFASLGPGEESADGQLQAAELKKILEMFKP